MIVLGLYAASMLSGMPSAPQASAGATRVQDRIRPDAAAPDADSQGEPASPFHGNGATLRTEHFSIRYDTSYEVLRPLVGRLEGTYSAVHAYCAALDLPVRAPDEAMKIVLFAHYADFSDYAATLGLDGPAMAGIYDQKSNVSVFCGMEDHPGLRPINLEIERTQDALKGFRDRQASSGRIAAVQPNLRSRLANLRTQRRLLVKRFNRLVIQHEAAHQVLFNLGVHVRGAQTPVWLTEGLACQFEVPQPGAARGHLAINQVRLGDFRSALKVAPGVREYAAEALQNAVASGRFLPLRTLSTEFEAFVQADGHEAFRYAQAWALVYFLDRNHQEALRRYLKGVARRRVGKPVGPEGEIAAFQDAFGEPDGEFERAWIDGVLGLQFDPRQAGG